MSSSTPMPLRTIPPFFIPPPTTSTNAQSLPNLKEQDSTADANQSSRSDTEGHPTHTRTRSMETCLPSDEAMHPRKKVKTSLTTVSATTAKEVEDLRSLRMYQLARTSRDAFAAQVNYRRLRVREIEMMHVIVRAELEEAEALLKNADLQMGEIRHDLCSNASPFTEENLDKFAAANLPQGLPLIPELYESDAESGVGPYDSASNSQTPSTASRTSNVA